ncbi:Kinase superfamily protein isoform 2 [Hibiscus syriacus]|uniref:Kinase superfamily protein isoform 2 n=2 Tax=Hibiscus syriacus TaxID=106335 RepID=A0A6A2X3Y9_HIBSY|nr:Kinase superfamily protein isoform 2 [Hibiscus syriacus]
MNLIHSNCIHKSQFSSSPVSIHGVPLQRRNKKKPSAFRVSNLAASTTEVAVDNGTLRRSLTTSTNSQNKVLPSTMSSSAMEQLDIERGVCIPFRKYSPATVAYPYVAKRLLTDPNPALRERLIQVLFKDGVFQWKRLENLIVLAKENVAKMSSNPALQVKKNVPSSKSWQTVSKLGLTDNIKDGARLFLFDEGIRRQLLLALTEDSKLHVEELVDVYRLVEDEIDVPAVAREIVRDFPNVVRGFLLSWSNSVLSDR